MMQSCSHPALLTCLSPNSDASGQSASKHASASDAGQLTGRGAFFPEALIWSHRRSFPRTECCKPPAFVAAMKGSMALPKAGSIMRIHCCSDATRRQTKVVV